MSTIQFHKYQGTGNDFIIIDNLDASFPKNKKVIEKLCSRKFGIGSDGLILIEAASNKNVDFIMNFYNPDGSQSFCGNGSRCAVAFAHNTNLISSSCRFEAIDGVHEATINSISGIVEIRMNPVEKISSFGTDFYLHTGSPHYIHLQKDIASFDLIKYGKSIRYSDDFKNQNGTNVNILQISDDHSIFIRTYERGVEDETLSCGTGVTACAIAYGNMHDLYNVPVQTKGGKLNVRFEKVGMGFDNIWLTGPAKSVFSGEISI